MITDLEGFAIGGRARQYQRQVDRSLDGLRESLKLEGMQARATAKTIWITGMNLIKMINSEIEPQREKLYPPAFYPALEQDEAEKEVKRRTKILDWGKDLKTPSPAVVKARRGEIYAD